MPAWIRRLILRGLKADPAARWESMAALIRALGDDPDIKLRRRFIVGGTIAVGAVSLLIAWQMVSRRRAEADREIGRQVAAATRDAGTARAAAAKALELRKRSFTAFDALDRDEGEASWKQARALVPAIDAGYDQAERAFESAFMLDPSRVEIRAQLADLRYEHLLFAEDFRLESKAQVLQERLASADANGSRRKALAAPGTLALAVVAADGARRARTLRSRSGHRAAGAGGGRDAGAARDVELAPGIVPAGDRRAGDGAGPVSVRDRARPSASPSTSSYRAPARSPKASSTSRRANSGSATATSSCARSS